MKGHQEINGRNNDDSRWQLKNYFLKESRSNCLKQSRCDGRSRAIKQILFFADTLP